MTLQRSTFPSDLEVRGDGRTVAGLVVPFDEPAQIGGQLGYTEVFRRGSFTRTLNERGPSKVKLLGSHDASTFPLGRATTLREDAAGLYGEFRISNTARGDEALALLNDGSLDAFSVGFVPVTDRWSRDRTSVERLEARLVEASLVALPAYDGARVLAVRSKQPLNPLDELALLRRRLALA